MKSNNFLSYAAFLSLSLTLIGCTQPSPETEAQNVPMQTQEIRTGEKASQSRRSQQGNVILHETTSGRISIAEARDLALAQVPGATAPNIQIRGGYDHGIVLYQGEIHFNNLEYDFEINAYTGEFTEWEIEPLHK